MSLDAKMRGDAVREEFWPAVMERGERKDAPAAWVATVREAAASAGAGRGSAATRGKVDEKAPGRAGASLLGESTDSAMCMDGEETLRAPSMNMSEEEMGMCV